MNKEFYDKYQKELDCKSCIGLQECSTNSNIPLCDKGYRRFAKDKIAELEQQLEESFTEEDVEGLIEDREKTIKFLQQQLTEKDKEIERWHKLYKDRNNQFQSVRQIYHLINSMSLEELKWLGVKANFESKKIHNFYYNQQYEIFMPNFRWK